MKLNHSLAFGDIAPDYNRVECITLTTSSMVSFSIIAIELDLACTLNAFQYQSVQIFSVLSLLYQKLMYHQ